MRLIDADAVKRMLCGYCSNTLCDGDCEETDALDALPTIDAVPVVRCKDCKHLGMHKSLNVPWCFKMHIDKSEDGYCDCGETKED